MYFWTLQGFYFNPRLVRIEEENDSPHIPLFNHLAAPPNVPNVAFDPPNDPNPTSMPENAPNPNKRPRVSKRSYNIDSIHLSFLVALYQQHFNKYSNLTKTKSISLSRELCGNMCMLIITRSSQIAFFKKNL